MCGFDSIKCIHWHLTKSSKMSQQHALCKKYFNNNDLKLKLENVFFYTVPVHRMI